MHGFVAVCGELGVLHSPLGSILCGQLTTIQRYRTCAHIKSYHWVPCIATGLLLIGELASGWTGHKSPIFHLAM